MAPTKQRVDDIIRKVDNGKKEKAIKKAAKEKKTKKDKDYSLSGTRIKNIISDIIGDSRIRTVLVDKIKQYAESYCFEVFKSLHRIFREEKTLTYKIV